MASKNLMSSHRSVQISSSLVPKDVSSTEKTVQEIQLKLEQLNTAKNEAVSKEDFRSASALKKQIASLEQTLSDLKQKTSSTGSNDDKGLRRSASQDEEEDPFVSGKIFKSQSTFDKAMLEAQPKKTDPAPYRAPIANNTNNINNVSTSKVVTPTSPPTTSSNQTGLRSTLSSTKDKITRKITETSITERFKLGTSKPSLEKKESKPEVKSGGPALQTKSPSFGTPGTSSNSSPSSPRLHPPSSTSTTSLSPTPQTFNSASQSHDSSFLEQAVKRRTQHQSIRGTLALQEAPLLQLLAQQGFDDKDIWEGDPKLFPVLYQFKNNLQDIKTSNSNAVQFVFPNVPEIEPGTVKAYKISPSQPISQVISSLCKKLNIANSQKYVLATLRDFVFNENDNLATYGLGTLYENWKLKLITKGTSSQIIAKPLVHKDGIVHFVLPPLVEFKGHHSTVMKVDIFIRVGQVIEALCDRFKIPDSQRFCLLTDSGFPGKDFLLTESSTLASYGLGVRFEKWKLKLNFHNLVQNEKKDLIRQSESLKWIQVAEANLQIEEAKKIIIDLDNDLFDKTDLLTTRELNELLLKEEKDKLIENVDQLTSHLEWYKTEYQNLSGMVTDLEENLVNMENKNSQLQMSVQEEKNHSARLTTKLKETIALLEKKEEENQKYKDYVDRFKPLYEKQKVDWQTKYDQLGENVKNKNKEIAQLSSQLQSSNLLVDELKAEQENSRTMIVSLERLSNLQAKKLEELTKQLESTQQGLVVNMEKIQQMANQTVQEQTAAFQQTISTLNSEKDKLKAELQNYKESLKMAGVEKQALQQRLEQTQLLHQTEIEMLQQKHQDMEFQIEQVKKKAQQEQENFKHKFADLEEEMDEKIMEKEKLLQNQQEMYEQKLKVLKDEIERLTAPPPAPTPPPVIFEPQNKVMHAKMAPETILKAKSALQKTQANKKQDPSDLVDVMFTSLKEKFSSVRNNDVEDLDELVSEIHSSEWDS